MVVARAGRRTVRSAYTDSGACCASPGDSLMSACMQAMYMSHCPNTQHNELCCCTCHANWSSFTSG